MPSLSDETGGQITRLLPGATIGIVGGGQLGRMMTLAAKYMGFRIGTLDPTPDCPTAQVADFQIVADYDNGRRFASSPNAATCSPTSSRTWMPTHWMRSATLWRFRRAPTCCA